VLPGSGLVRFSGYSQTSSASFSWLYMQRTKGSATVVAGDENAVMIFTSRRRGH